MYRTFLRSANSWAEFVRATKWYTGMVYSKEEDARQACRDYNANRTDNEVRRGTKLEYESE